MRIPGIRRLFRIDRGRDGVRASIDDEIQFHFDMTVRDLIAGGMSPDSARHEAERRFGNVQHTRDRLAHIDLAHTQQRRRAEWLSALAQDMRYAIRGLRLKPGFTIAVVLTLGLGIGANATMFSIVDQLLFRPPTYLASPERASRVYHVVTQRGAVDSSSDFGYRRFLDMRENTAAFDAMTPETDDIVAVGTGSDTRQMHIGAANADLWKMFEVRPVIGRFFTDDECALPSGSPVVVLSYGFWQTEFSGRKNVLGTQIQLGASKFTIIGVAPDGFNGFESKSLVAFVPFAADMKESGLGLGGKVPWHEMYNMTWFNVFARRKPGVTAAQADADLSAAYLKSYQRQLAADPVLTPISVARPHAFAGPVLAERGPGASPESRVATWLAAFAGIVLLIACANVANLLLARALRRQREIAVRLALGVSRSRLLVQLLVESTLLSLAGGVAGIAIAQWASAGLRALLASELRRVDAWTDHRVLAFSAVLAMLTGILTGLSPAFHALRTDIAGALKSGSREGSVHRSRTRAGLLVFQGALSVVLLVGAGLFLRSLANVESTRLGFDYDKLLWMRTDMRGVELDSIQTRALYDRLQQRAKQLPMVENASIAATAPFQITFTPKLVVAGYDTVRKLGQFTLQAATPEYFTTAGTRILRGRGFTSADRKDAPLVAVVSKAMGERLWPGEDAIGKCIRVGKGDQPCSTVVGIAEDVHVESLDKASYQYFLPLDQFSLFKPSGIFVRVKASAAAAADVVRRGVQPEMPGAAYVTMTPMSEVVGGQMRSWQLGATMFAAFGGLALLLAAVGLYSVIAYNVAQRTHEMGVRVALGANPGDVISLIVREGLRIVLPGVAIGAGISLFAGRWIAPLLFGVSPKDPPVMVGVIATLVAVAVVASWIPAIRAARVDPNIALRAD